MSEETGLGSDVELAETTALARLLMVSRLDPMGQDDLDARQAERKELWANEKQSFMAQARRLRRLIESSDNMNLVFEGELVDGES